MTISLRKIILLWGFVLFLTSIASGRPNPRICRKKNGNFPIPGTYCRGYYECKSYVPEEKTCGDREHFNANKGLCDWEELYPCLEKQKDKECLRENGLFLKPGTNCKKYYRCCNGRAKTEVCSGDSLFDPFRGICEWPDLYTCIESLSTTEKVSSTETIFTTTTTTTAPDDEYEKSSTDLVISTSTVQKTTSSERITYSTTEPDFERTNSTILETSTRSDTQPTDDQSTSESSETSTISPPTNEISTYQPTANEISTSQPTSAETSTSLSTTTETSTLQPTTIETSTLQPTTIEVSTLPPTTSEIPITSQTTTPQISSTQSTHHTIKKEDKEGDITKQTVFETTTEKTFSPSTVEVTTSAELNFMCPEPNGYFPHPTDKHKFVGCVHNIPSILTCPSNLIYKHRLRRCDYE